MSDDFQLAVDGDAEELLLGSEWSIADLVDHLLNRGVVIHGRVTISVAGIDLMHLGLQVVFTSVENLLDRDARRLLN